jgi:adenylate kinase
MSEIQLHDKTFESYISAERIEKAIKKIASELEEYAGDETLVFVSVLKGSFMFSSDLAKMYQKPVIFEFFRLKSYEGTQSTGEVQILVDIEAAQIRGKKIIVLEDIVDTGNTLEKIYEVLQKKNPHSIKIATLFFKPEAYKKDLPIDFIGMEIPNDFIVGYGLDYDELGRNLPEIYKLKEVKNKRTVDIVLFGPPGAGKGTQASILKDKLGLQYIATGDLFRHHIKNKTALGKKAQQYIDNGELVPDEITIGMIKELIKNPESKGFIFDGFPRTVEQAQALDEIMAEKGLIIDALLSLNVPEDRLVKRLLNRGKTSGRTDDNEETIKKRLQQYHEKTTPVKDYYAKQGKLYEISGVGEIDEIHNRLMDIINNLKLNDKKK